MFSLPLSHAPRPPGKVPRPTAPTTKFGSHLRFISAVKNVHGKGEGTEATGGQSDKRAVRRDEGGEREARLRLNTRGRL